MVNLALPPKQILLFLSLAFVCLGASSSKGTILFESATQGPSGQTAGWRIDSNQFFGAGFHLDSPAQITSVGAHMFSTEGSLFAALIQVDGPIGLPLYSPPYDASTVIASTVFEATFPSMVVQVPLSVVLDPGYYALLLGTDQLGASNGYAGLPSEGQEAVGDAYELVWMQHPSAGEFQWFRYALGCRFVIEGHAIPEPASLAFWVIMVAVVLRSNRHLTVGAAPSSVI